MAKTEINYALIMAGIGLALFLFVLVLGFIAQIHMPYRLGSAQSYLMAGPAAAGGQAAAGYITVTAEGAAYGIPDQEQVSVYVNGTGDTAAAAASSLSLTLAKFNDTVVPFVNGNLSDIQTTSYSLTKQYNRSVYTAEEGITVTIPNITNASAALGALSDMSNVYVYSASSVFSQGMVTQLRDQALAYALSNATAQAQVLAGGPVAQHNITVSSYVFYPLGASYPVGVAVDASGGFQSTGPTPIVYTGRSAVQESVTVQFSYAR